MQEDPVHTYWNKLGLMSNARKSYREMADPVLLIDHNMHQGTFHGYLTTPEDKAFYISDGWYWVLNHQCFHLVKCVVDGGDEE